MGIIRTAVSLAAFGVAANMIMKARREGRAAGVGSGSTGWLGGSGSATDSLGSTGSMGTSGAGLGGADSLNAGEGLRDRGLAGSSVGGGGAGSTNLFDSTSQVSEEARSPGLPDFARGA